MKTLFGSKAFNFTLFVLQILLVSTAFGEGLKNPGKIVTLITAQEAAQPDAKNTKGMFGSKDASDGPVIEILAPTPDTEIEKPCPIKISFKENQAPIDLDSLEVSYIKLFSVDITDRVKPYVTIKGIDIEKADLPSGYHKVKFSIRDTQDNLSERTLKIHIL